MKPRMIDRVIRRRVKEEWKEIREILNEASQMSKETDAKIAAVSVEQVKTDAQSRKTSADIDKMSIEIHQALREMSREIGGIGNSNGRFAETFFVNALAGKTEFAGIKFDHFAEDIKGYVAASQSGIKGGIDDQFDGVFYNGDSIGIVEVKYKAKTKNLENLYKVKVPNFRAMFPQYKDYKFYLGLAGLSFDDELRKDARDLGICLLKQKGEHVESDISFVKPY